MPSPASNRKFLNRENEKWAYIHKTDEPSRGLVFFVHGYSGNYLGTWGKLPFMLEQQSTGQREFEAWDYFFLGYSTGAIDCCLDIAHRLASELLKASQGQAPYLQAYDRFALVGHSLGTLGIRQLLCASALHTPPHLLQLLHSITLFGTPLNGSPLARFGLPFFTVSAALQPASPQLRMLKVWNDEAYATRAWPAPLVVLGLEDKVVGNKYADLLAWAGDVQPPAMVSAGHIDMVKPQGWDSLLIDYLRQALA